MDIIDTVDNILEQLKTFIINNNSKDEMIKKVDQIKYAIITATICHSSQDISNIIASMNNIKLDINDEK